MLYFDYPNFGAELQPATLFRLSHTVSNSQLKPESSRKHFSVFQCFVDSFGFGRYFLPQTLSKKPPENRHHGRPGERRRHSSTDYPEYSYISATNSLDTSTTDGFTFEYRQQLAFLHGGPEGLEYLQLVDPRHRRRDTPNKTINWNGTPAIPLQPLQHPAQRQLGINLQSKLVQ